MAFKGGGRNSVSDAVERRKKGPFLKAFKTVCMQKEKKAN